MRFVWTTLVWLLLPVPLLADGPASHEAVPPAGLATTPSNPPEQGAPAAPVTQHNQTDLEFTKQRAKRVAPSAHEGTHTVQQRIEKAEEPASGR
jgi:hypothetical protein